MGKGGETALNILGSLFDIGGTIATGNPNAGQAFGNPFRMGAESIRAKREQEALIQILSENEHTAPLVQMGGQVLGQGGLMSMLGGGQEPSPATLPSGSNMLPGESNGIPDYRAGIPMPSDPTSVPVVSGALLSPREGLMSAVTTPTSQGGQDGGSLLLKAAQAGILDADTFRKILFAKAQQKPDSSNGLDAIKDILGIQSALTGIPGTQQFDAKQKADISKIEATVGIRNKAIEGRQEEERAFKSEERARRFVQGQQKDLGKIETAQSSYERLWNIYKNGIEPNLAKGLLAKNTTMAQLAQRSPEFAEFIPLIREVRRNILAETNAFTGAQASDAERKYITGSLPSDTDTPEVFAKSVAQNLERLKYGRYLMAQNSARATGHPGVVQETYGYSPQQLEIFRRLRERMNKTGPESIYKDEQAIKYMQFLGIRQ